MAKLNTHNKDTVNKENIGLGVYERWNNLLKKHNGNINMISIELAERDRLKRYNDANFMEKNWKIIRVFLWTICLILFVIVTFFSESLLFELPLMLIFFFNCFYSLHIKDINIYP